MNTTVTAVRGYEHQHPPQRVNAPRAYTVPHVSLLDRAAMRVGLALLMWGRRHSTAARSARRLTNLERDSVHREVEAAAQRTYWLLLPPR